MGSTTAPMMRLRKKEPCWTAGERGGERREQKKAEREVGRGGRGGGKDG